MEERSRNGQFPSGGRAGRGGQGPGPGGGHPGFEKSEPPGSENLAPLAKFVAPFWGPENGPVSGARKRPRVLGPESGPVLGARKRPRFGGRKTAPYVQNHIGGPFWGQKWPRVGGRKTAPFRGPENGPVSEAGKRPRFRGQKTALETGPIIEPILLFSGPIFVFLFPATPRLPGGLVMVGRGINGSRRALKETVRYAIFLPFSGPQGGPTFWTACHAMRMRFFKTSP